MSGAIPPLPNTPSWRGAQLKHRDSFTFTSTSRVMKNIISHNIYSTLPDSNLEHKKKVVRTFEKKADAF
jgi:hypothetical protein